jgi:hypothetical protein
MGLAIRAFLIALFAVLKRWKLVLFFFLFNLFFSLFLALPVFKSLSAQGGHYSGLRDYLLCFDPEAWVDFLYNNPHLLNGLFLSLGVGGVLYYVLFHLLSGGLIGILVDPQEKTSMKTFLNACGRFFFRYVRILFYFALLLVVLALINRSLDKGLNWYFNDVQEFEAGAGSLGWFLFAKNVVMILLLAFALVAFNYAKTATVLENRHFTGGALISGMIFATVHPIVTGLFFLLSNVVLLAVLLAYVFLSRWIDPTRSYVFLESLGTVTLSGALLYVLLAQAIQLLIQACLVFRHAGQVYIYRYLTVQSAHPDPELAAPEPYKPFIADRPYTGPDEKPASKKMEDHGHA